MTLVTWDFTSICQFLVPPIFKRYNATIFMLQNRQ